MTAEPHPREAQPALLELLRALTVRHDDLGIEIVLNSLLASLVANAQYEQAERIVAACPPPQPHRSTNQAARYFYYLGLIRAVRLDYAEAHACLQQALRKAPERAIGFRIAATKLSLTVQLLLGEIPARSEFLQPGLKEALAPYLALASCVRFGQLGRFQSLLQQQQQQLETDRTYSLMLRVRRHVLRTGLRRICQAYSRVSLADVCVKLALENPGDCEMIVAKAIRDGVIDARIERSGDGGGVLVSSETVDVYHSTSEPLAALGRRVAFLSHLHDEARRAIRFTETEEEAERRKRQEQAAREDMARAMLDDDGGDVDFTDM